MTVIYPGSKGRNFTAEELLGRQIRIEGPAPRSLEVPVGHTLMVLADDEQVNNVLKIELILEPSSIVEARLTLFRKDRITRDIQKSGEVPTEEVTLRDDVRVSLSAIVSTGMVEDAVQDHN